MTNPRSPNYWDAIQEAQRQAQQREQEQTQQQTQPQQPQPAPIFDPYAPGGGDGKRHIRYQCTNKICARYTIKPLKSK
jgi:hypothetical protein